MTLRPEYEATRIALRTLGEAFVRVASQRLGLEPNELQAEFRPALTPLHTDGREAEIYLYDTLSGGAGFARQAGRLGGELFELALELLQSCPQNCDASCYRCLRSYRNKLDHGYLDREVAASLLSLALHGERPSLAPEREQSSMDVLYEDLRRQGLGGVEFRRGVSINIPEFQPFEAPILATSDSRGPLVVGLQIPLAPDEPSDGRLTELRDYGVSHQLELVDDLVIRKNLPAATRQVLSRLGAA